jgi:hypothetical protein
MVLLSGPGYGRDCEEDGLDLCQHSGSPGTYLSLIYLGNNFFIIKTWKLSVLLSSPRPLYQNFRQDLIEDTS